MSAQTQTQTQLSPAEFVTGSDRMHDSTGYAVSQLEKGRELGRTAETFYISERGCWAARMRDGSFVQSFERLGYHACTAELVTGLLETGIEAGIEIVDRRQS